jgi:hypothetical protein
MPWLFVSYYSFHQHAFTLCDADDSLRTRVKFQKVIFDAVAEYHAVFGHARFEDQWGFGSDTTNTSEAPDVFVGNGSRTV